MGLENKHARLLYYRRFTDERNKYAEAILDKYRIQIADQLRPAFSLIAQVYMSTINQHAKQILSWQIKHTASQIEQTIKRMRSNIYKLTLTSESEVLSRISDKRNHHTNPMHSLHKILHKDLEAGGSIAARVEYYLNGLVRKLDSLAELAAVKGDTLHIEEIKSIFPKFKKLPNRAELHRLVEADKIPKPNVSTDSVTDEEWSDIVGDYQDEYIPVNRGPDAISSDEDIYATHLATGGQTPEIYSDTTYDWELEQDLTHDFIQTVRDGQNEAADENGIVDMLWVAILDKVTDDCCIWRDGLTSAEIEAELKDKHSDDDCQAIVAPAHFNCRCSMEPSTENLPDSPMSNKDDFDSWLNS